jgi:hypothetical protein
MSGRALMPVDVVLVPTVALQTAGRAREHPGRYPGSAPTLLGRRLRTRYPLAGVRALFTVTAGPGGARAGPLRSG